MPDQLTPEHTLAPTHTAAPARAARRRGWWQAPLVVVLFVVVGIGLGVLWEQLWSPTEGLVVRRQWFVVDEDLRFDLDGLRNQFTGTALFVSLGLVGGAVTGLVSALLLARHELRTLAAVVVGSALGTVLMWQVGTRLGPVDPEVLARTSPRGTVLPDDLELGSLGALVAMPLGAVAALTVVFFLLPSRRTPGDPS